MSRAAIKPLRKQQLIDATLESVATHGLPNTTIMTISRIAGMSSGIISHYFGGKQELIEATVNYLLDQLQQSLLESITEENLDHRERLMFIVEANFNQFQKSSLVTKTWISFWASSMHDPALARLQSINIKRLESNLRFSFKKLGFDDIKAEQAAKQTSAMIDGFWLRSALSDNSEYEFEIAEELCKNFVESLVASLPNNLSKNGNKK